MLLWGCLVIYHILLTSAGMADLWGKKRHRHVFFRLNGGFTTDFISHSIMTHSLNTDTHRRLQILAKKQRNRSQHIIGICLPLNYLLILVKLGNYEYLKLHLMLVWHSLLACSYLRYLLYFFWCFIADSHALLDLQELTSDVFWQDGTNKPSRCMTGCYKISPTSGHPRFRLLACE